MDKEVFSVLFALLHTCLESVPSLEVLITHIADFLGMIMLNDESVTSGFHPVNMEVDFVIWVNFAGSVCDRVGVGHEWLLVLHNCHYDTGPVLLVKLIQP